MFDRIAVYKSMYCSQKVVACVFRMIMVIEQGMPAGFFHFLEKRERSPFLIVLACIYMLHIVLNLSDVVCLLEQRFYLAVFMMLRQTVPFAVWSFSETALDALCVYLPYCFAV